MNWFTPDLYNANWSHANYVHLRVTVQWHHNERSLDYMPLQLILHSGGRSFILFGKNNATQSYLWRRGNHYGNDVGARYPDHVGDDAKVIFHPIDYVVFDGMKGANRMNSIVLLDRAGTGTEHRRLQKSIERAVVRGRYEWRTLRVREDGTVSVEA